MSSSKSVFRAIRRRFSARKSGTLIGAILLLGIAPSSSAIADSGKSKQSIDSKNSAAPVPIDSSRAALERKERAERMLWGDVHFFREWHIQERADTHEFRLLDPEDKAIATGSFDDCRTRLAEIRKEKKLAPMRGEAVVLVHGLIRSYSRMLAAREALLKAGYQNVFVFDYASTEVDIPTAAESLERAMQSLEGIDRIHFVGHSMGGIVIRQWMAKHPDPRVGRLVMLGTPNQGAELSDRFQSYTAFRVVFGPAASQLVTSRATRPESQPDESGHPSSPGPAAGTFLADLPIPKCEFAIVTGSGGGEGFNPWIPGDDDGIVSVASTRLPGAADSMTVRCAHARLTREPAVLDCIVRFLKEGRLKEQGPTVPIPVIPAKSAKAGKSPATSTLAVPQN